MFYRHIRQSILIGIVLGFGIAAIFWAGYLFHDFLNNTLLQKASPQSFALLQEVQTQLNQRFLREQPSPSVREYGAVRGLLATLNDPFTFFIEPQVAQSESDVLAGVYGGVGVQTVRNEQGQILLYPYPDSPALQAGVMDGDVLVRVANQDITADIHLDTLDQMLRGEVKDKNGVEITVSREGQSQTLFVPFAVISIPSVIWRLLPEDPRIGYLQITLFTNRTPQEFRDAITQLNAEKISGLILDLRQNSGGLLQESVNIASYLLPSGSVVAYEKTRDADKPLMADVSELPEVTMPLVVLVNHQTASAAEIVSAAMQDYRRAVLLGGNTYGKGSVQQIVQLTDGSALHITFAEWLTPNHRQIDRVGLQPDISIDNPNNLFDTEIKAAITYLGGILGQAKP